jgi:ABC-2 type transport system permease protein
VAVYKKTYSRYSGALTPERTRFLVIPRYLFEEMRQRRFFTVFFSATMLTPVIFAIIIYLHHNLSAIQALKINLDRLISIDARFFMTFLGVQSMLAFLMTAFVGPGLISPDLANNALPLYLSRPFSRDEYILGKFSVLGFLLSMMTWVPGLLLFLLQGYLEGGGWMAENLRIFNGIFFGSWIWIAVVSLMALSLSAWVKWKPVAGALLFGVFFVASGFGFAVNQVMRTKWGNLINVGSLVGSVWSWLFEQPALRRNEGPAFFRVRPGTEIPPEYAWLMLAGLCCFCVWLLHKRIRGAEVVK